MTQLRLDVLRQRPVVLYIMSVSVRVNITVCGAFISPGTVGTDGASLVTPVTVHGAGGKDGVQTDTRGDEVFYLERAFSAWCR